MNTQEITRLEYGRVHAADRRAERGPDTPERFSALNEAVTWGVLGICLAAWSVIGLFLWIPRLLRAVLIFSVALVQSTVVETGAESAGRRLRSAANFYRRGFVGAVESIRSPRGRRKGDSDEDRGIEPWLILGETAWALFVWYLALWLAGFALLTPNDLVSSLAAAPWSEVGSSAVQALTSIPEMFRR